MSMLLLLIAFAGKPLPGYTIPLLDLSKQTDRQFLVDREKGQYLGHPTTVLLDDGKTMIAVYPKGHGKGAIVMKRSNDGGKTWSKRLPTPKSWATSQEVPTLYRTVDALGKKHLIMFSGLYPIRMAHSEDEGQTWTELEPIGNYGGIVAMGCCFPIKTGAGHYMAMFHDDGRFFTHDSERGKRIENAVMTLYKTISTDGGLTWGKPEAIQSDSEYHLCEPGVVRSPDGKQLAVLLRENRRKHNSCVIFSNDEGKTWTPPRELPGSLTGDRHTAVYAPDGRLFISFRDTTLKSPTQGDWVAWVGTYQDIVAGNEGQYRVRLMDNHHQWDCAYPGVVIQPDGTIVTTTYGHWIKDEPPYIMAVRLKLAELDALANLNQSSFNFACRKIMLKMLIHLCRRNIMADEVTPEKQQARMKEFIGLLPLTLELSGLPKCDPDRLFTPDQMEARATTVRAAFKLARSIVKEIAEGKG